MRTVPLKMRCRWRGRLPRVCKLRVKISQLLLQLEASNKELKDLQETAKKPKPKRVKAAPAVPQQAQVQWIQPPRTNTTLQPVRKVVGYEPKYEMVDVPVMTQVAVGANMYASSSGSYTGPISANSYTAGPVSGAVMYSSNSGSYAGGASYTGANIYSMSSGSYAGGTSYTGPISAGIPPSSGGSYQTRAGAGYVTAQNTYTPPATVYSAAQDLNNDGVISLAEQGYTVPPGGARVSGGYN